MSMLGEQIKELREAARNIQGNLGRCLYRRNDVDERQQVSGMLFEAADTIESLRDRLQAVSETCEWLLEHSGTIYDKWRCSKCGYLYVDSRTDGGATELEPNYCPNCGAKVAH